ncbi:MAG: cytochrome c family protein [Sphingomonadaceae bacterium]|nr:cytochrome c family protein [Sphingomonadaceae bacterium]
MRSTVALGLAAALALPAAAQAQAPKPPASALICQTCHAWQKGQNRVGPSLAGVVGRPAASVPGYNYSQAALKYKGRPWTPAELDKYLTNPQAVVPGTKMAYPGQKDPAKRKEIIAFLSTLK